MTLALLSLGSNQDAEHHLRAAVAALRERFPVHAVSPAYRTPAVGFDGPQSPAEFTISRSAPYISTMSAARCGVHFDTG